MFLRAISLRYTRRREVCAKMLSGKRMIELAGIRDADRAGSRWPREEEEEEEEEG